MGKLTLIAAILLGLPVILGAIAVAVMPIVADSKKRKPRTSVFEGSGPEDLGRLLLIRRMHLIVSPVLALVTMGLFIASIWLQDSRFALTALVCALGWIFGARVIARDASKEIARITAEKAAIEEPVRDNDPPVPDFLTYPYREGKEPPPDRSWLTTEEIGKRNRK